MDEYPNDGEEYVSSANDYITPTTLFVGDLSFFCNEDDIRKLFSTYGVVLHAEIKRGKATGDSLMHGFIEMDTETAAETAMRELSNEKFMGRKLRVCWGNGRNPNNNTAKDRENWIQLHVSFVSRQLEKIVNEEIIDTVFSGFGEVSDVTVKRHKVTKEPVSQSGYGFVYFSDPATALRAVYVMKHTTIDSITYDCSISYRSEKLLLASNDANIQEQLSLNNITIHSHSKSSSTSTSSSVNKHSYSTSTSSSVKHFNPHYSQSTFSPHHNNNSAVPQQPTASHPYPNYQPQSVIQHSNPHSNSLHTNPRLKPLSGPNSDGNRHNSNTNNNAPINRVPSFTSAQSNSTSPTSSTHDSASVDTFPSPPITYATINADFGRYNVPNSRGDFNPHGFHTIPHLLPSIPPPYPPPMYPMEVYQGHMSPVQPQGPYPIYGHIPPGTMYAPPRLIPTNGAPPPNGNGSVPPNMYNPYFNPNQMQMGSVPSVAMQPSMYVDYSPSNDRNQSASDNRSSNGYSNNSSNQNGHYIARGNSQHISQPPYRSHNSTNGTNDSNFQSRGHHH